MKIKTLNIVSYLAACAAAVFAISAYIIYLKMGGWGVALVALSTSFAASSCYYLGLAGEYLEISQNPSDPFSLKIRYLKKEDDTAAKEANLYRQIEDHRKFTEQLAAQMDELEQENRALRDDLRTVYEMANSSEAEGEGDGEERLQPVGKRRKLTEEDRQRIPEEAGNSTHEELAQKYGVSRQYIGNICRQAAEAGRKTSHLWPTR